MVWAMVNTALLEQAAGKGFALHRNVMRRLGWRVVGGEVLTKAKLRSLMESEDTCRSLVHQLMSVGRDVRSTPMQWSYEGKKLDCAVKHLSWCPPWVEGAESAGPEGEFLQDNRRVPDTLGLGRIPAFWWTLNCRYNAAYDIHRLNVGSQVARAAVDVADDARAADRFAFIRDCPDLATFMLGVRT